MAKSKSILGDERLEVPHGKLLKAMVLKQDVVLRNLGSNRTEEVVFGRFLSNPRITPSNIVSQYWASHPVSWAGKHLLIVGDTTTASFGLFPNRSGLGYLGKGKTTEGFHLHSALVMNAVGASCCGLGAVHAYITAEKDAETKALRRKNTWKIPFKEKERYKWYSVAEEAIRNCPGAARYTIVGDRESDIYDVYARIRGKNWDFVSRLARDRRVDNVDEPTLYANLAEWPVQHSYELKLPATKKRSAHKATLDLKFGSAQLLRPAGHPDKNLPGSLPVFAVEVKEQSSTVVGNEKPIHWMLITSHEVKTVEQAMQIVRWYIERWTIEQTFRTLKSEGLDIENSEVETFEALANLATMALIAATQVMQLVKARDGQTDQNIEEAFTAQEIECIHQLNTQVEGKTDKLKNPYPKNSLAFASWVIARLGGWSGYVKAQRPPGPITMLNGMLRFYNILYGFVMRSQHVKELAK